MIRSPQLRIAHTTIALVTLAMLPGCDAGPSGEQVDSSLTLFYQNDFDTPDEVIRYFIERDLAGDVWLGLLAAERTAVTTWSYAPWTESFLVATSYEIAPVTIEGAVGKTEVHYKIRSMADAYGSESINQAEDYIVTFELEKIENQWKIRLPAARDYKPVLGVDSALFSSP